MYMYNSTMQSASFNETIHVQPRPVIPGTTEIMLPSCKKQCTCSATDIAKLPIGSNCPCLTIPGPQVSM